jgi:carboxypeptidase D
MAGGYYIPYIADAMLKEKDMVYFNVSGILIYDPIIGDQDLQSQGER